MKDVGSSIGVNYGVGYDGYFCRCCLNESRDVACLEFTDHCLNEAFNASCPEDRVVLVTEARFGRMRPGRCIGGAFNVGCYKNIKSHLDALCTARSRCDVSVRDLVDLHPCQRDFVSYLEAGYICVEGRAAPDTQTFRYSMPKTKQYTLVNSSIRNLTTS